MLQIMAMTDQHACAVVKLVVPDGNGVVINGSPTVLINGLPACRMGDTILETTSINSITGGEPTVLIGNGATAGVSIDPSINRSLQELGQAHKTAEERKKAEKETGE